MRRITIEEFNERIVKLKQAINKYYNENGDLNDPHEEYHLNEALAMIDKWTIEDHALEYGEELFKEDY